MLAPRPGRYDRSSVGFALSLLLVSLGVVLVVHHRIPPAVQPEVIAGGAVLIVLGVVGLLLSARFWTSWGGPASLPRRRTSSPVKSSRRRSR